MGNAIQCHPSRDQLAAYLAAQTNEAETSDIEQHLATCDRCCEVLEGLPRDTLGGLLAPTSAPLLARRDAPPTVNAEMLATTPPLPGDLLDHPRYQILAVLGSGGMGTVYQAKHRLMDRMVALKVINRQLTEKPDAVARFRQEVKAAARLAHPNIVTAYDAEQAGDTHLLVMEFVVGTSLAELVAHGKPLPVAQACDYIRQAALGLQHASACGMAHRDIKPHNLMLTPDGQVKILDFGLAHFLCQTAPAEVLTQSGMVMGTPDYMAPEQGLDAHQADIRADIYSLGCTLYFLLTGRVPFPDKNHLEKLLAHQLEQPCSVATLRADLPAGVVAVLEKMMAKKPAERYQTPAEVAAALQPLAAPAAAAPSAEGATAPLSAVGSSSIAAMTTAVEPRTSAAPAVAAATRTQIRQPEPLRRRKRLVALAVALVLAGMVVGAATFILRTRHGTLTVNVMDPDVEVIVDEQQRVSIDSSKVGKLELLPGEHKLIVKRGQEELYAETFTLKRGGQVIIEARWTPKTQENKPPVAGNPLDQLDPAAIPAGQRFAWQPKELVAVLGDHRQRHWGGVRSVAFGPDGKLLASVGPDGVRLWEVPSMRERAWFKEGGRYSIAFSADGKWLASISSSVARLTMLDLTNGQQREISRMTEGPSSSYSCVALAPDGKTLAGGGQDKDGLAVWLWDISGPRPKKVAALKTHSSQVRTLAFAPDGKLLAVGGADQTVWLWDLTGAEPKECAVLKGHTGRVEAVAFAPAGRLLASGSTDGTVRLYEIAGTVAKLKTVFNVGAGRDWVAFAPNDAGLLAIGDGGRKVNFWDLKGEEPKLRHALHVPVVHVNSVAFAPDGGLLATGSADGTVQLWDLKGVQPKEVPALEGPAGMRSLAIAPTNRTLATAHWSVDVHLWNLAGAAFEPGPVLKGHSSQVRSVVFDSAGRTLISGSEDGTVRLWDLDGSKARMRRVLKADGPVGAVAASPDGTRLAARFLTGETICFWQIAGAESTKWLLKEHTDQITEVAFSSDSKMLAAGSRDGTICLWDLQGPEPKKRSLLQRQSNHVGALAFAPDGKTLAAGGEGVSPVRLWELTGAEPVEKTVLDASRVQSLAFAPDGRSLATTEYSGRVILWDLTSPDRTRLKVWELPGPVLRVAFSGDGRYLITGNSNGTVYILRLAAADKQGK